MRAWNRAFRERELLLRVDGRVRYLRLSRRRQTIWAAGALGLGVWLAGSTVGLFYMDSAMTTAEGNAQEKAQEISTVQDASLLRDLSRAEGRLADLSAERSELMRRAEGLEQGLALAEKDKERLAGQRAEVGRNLARSEGRLADLSAENAASARRAHGFERSLALAERDKAALAAERARLEQDLTVSEGRLAELSAEKARSAAHGEELDRRLALAVRDRERLAAEQARLERDLAWAEGRLAAISADKAELERTLGDFEAGYALALSSEPILADRIETLGGALEVAVDRAERAESQRDFFEKRAERLERRLDGIAEVQNGVVRRLADTTLQGVGMIEKIVAMTGLNVNELILNLEPAKLASDRGLASDQGLVSDQGGPFLPGSYAPHDYGPGDFLPEQYEAEDQGPGGFLSVDYMSGDFMSGEIVDGDFVIADDPDLEFQVSVFLLDQQMDRWEALQRVIRSVPLSSPLDQYRLSSGFGKRPDPVNGHSAMHLGLDLSAPLRTPVLATAPGRVVFAGWMGGHGRIVELDHGNGIRTRYGHLRKFLVEKGQEVEHRREIGLLGKSGRTTGPHVHYEVLVNGIPYDPMKFLMAGRNAFKG